MDPLITMRGVTKSFGIHQVLKGIDLDIRLGKITVIIGGSGSGKSVLTKHMNGLLTQDEGEVCVFGENITQCSESELNRIRGRFGMLFQHAALFDSMNVGDNIAFPLLERTKVPKKERMQKVAELLESLNLPGIEKQYPSELSGGMKKRVGLARAIIMNPDVMIYDEPTTGLDPIMIKSVDDMILETQERFKVTSIVISHDMVSTFRIGNYIAMLHKGKIIAYGTPEEIRNCPDERVQNFIHGHTPPKKSSDTSTSYLE